MGKKLEKRDKNRGNLYKKIIYMEKDIYQEKTIDYLEKRDIYREENIRKKVRVYMIK